MEPWKDSEQPKTNLTRFERVMVDAGIQKSDWITRFIPVSGKALVAYSHLCIICCLDYYEKMKEAMLEALGVSINQCRRVFWNFLKKHQESPQEMCR